MYLCPLDLWLVYNSTMTKYYERGVFIDQGSFVITRLWRGGILVRDFAALKPQGVRCADGSIEVQFKDNPPTAEDAAKRWGSTVEEVVINP